MDLFEQKLLEKMDELIRVLKEFVPPKKKNTKLDYLYECYMKRENKAFQGSIIVDDPCKPDGEK